MKLARRIDLFMGFLVIVALVMLAAPSWAGGDRDNDCNGHGNCNDIDITEGGAGGDGGEGGHGGEGGAGGDGGQADADSSASTGPIDNASAGGSANVSTKNESTSLVLQGARDTADCFTKVTIGAEGFGIGFSRSDPYCKKVRLIARNIDRGNYEAAARLECTLPEWEEVYGHKRVFQRNSDQFEPGYQDCLDALTFTEEDLGAVTLPAAQYEELVAQAVQGEELEEYVEQQEYRYAQQQNAIESVRQEHEADAAELERLKREAAALREAEESRAAKRKAALAALDEDDDDDSGPESDN